MANEIPYMASSGNIDAIIQKIRNAGTPPRFTHEFLSSTLGFRSSNDRNIPKVLRALGMITNDGVPTERYNAFKNELTGGLALAEGLREGWSKLYLADQTAHDRTSTELQQIFKTVTGKSDAVAQKMATTFTALVKHADFSSPAAPPINDKADHDSNSDEDVETSSSRSVEFSQGAPLINLRHDVHVHLPPTTDPAVYTAIFRALRDELLD